ncbi:heme ABC transporter ATP-binding protein [Methylicorpusculum oleiharenae]|uniref:heme ABC transporter ATP-binding protein n=1 Tax=Methylicorpusculum oleiharenae TaxID=1338687 RepID=UPI001356F9B4|nr:heme ABC transporter ATP-binding protein [Methylicorpusculum oleiharenae]MCD2449885.1 heme ABC transporter ATP-binding protein [Methylicorpusculum oleiharenae]
MLQANNISVTLGRAPIIKNISLTVSPGKFLAIAGPNGAGKSTLMKALCGDLPTYEGHISMNSKALPDWRRAELAKIRGILPQSSSLAFPLTVHEVVMMGRSPHSDKRDLCRDEWVVSEALSACGIEVLRNRKYTQLSGGEKQRVQFARVLAQIWGSGNDQARYLFLDEPTSALDLAHQHSILRIALQLAKTQGIAVIAILHDLNLAAMYADQIAMLKNGKIIDLDIPEKILRPSLIQYTFGFKVMVTRHPQMNGCPMVIATLH